MECIGDDGEGREHHCFHEVRPGEEYYPGEICCWCGDVFIARYEEGAVHGPYKPRKAEQVKGSFEAAERMRKQLKIYDAEDPMRDPLCDWEDLRLVLNEKAKERPVLRAHDTQGGSLPRSRKSPHRRR